MASSLDGANTTDKVCAGETSTPSSQPDKTGPEEPKLLDLAFAMDCTGSMGKYIRQAQQLMPVQNIRKISEDIFASEQADIHLALVEYRDHPPQDSSFVTRAHDFTSSVREMKSWLDNCKASGGGDTPEAVADALHQLLKLNWREDATKICVFIADAPPHGLVTGSDGFPNGCPDGLDPMVIANQLAEKGVAIYIVGCEPSISPYKEWFTAVAHITGGQYVPLTSASVLTKVITSGAQEELSLQQLMQEVNLDVIQEFSSSHEPIDERLLSEKIRHKFASKGAKAKKLVRNNFEMPKPSAEACMYADIGSMESVKKEFKLTNPVAGVSATKKKKSAVKGRLSRGKAEVPVVHAEDHYEVLEEAVSDFQVDRMVARSIQTNKLKSQVKPKTND